MPADPSPADERHGWVTIHPRYRRRFARWGLTTAAAFLDLPGEVVSGHPDRHVVRVALGRGRRRFVAFLKREHRIPWRDRLTNALAGFGWVSKSEREARLLRQLRQANIPVPRWLAFGEDGRGRAFLLLRAVPKARDLRTFLYGGTGIPHRQHMVLARRLGRLLADVHTAGFDCPDLSSKHILARHSGRELTLIDWPRSRRRMVVPWRARVRDLAALNASLAQTIATPRERLTCLHAYLSSFDGRGGNLSRRNRRRFLMATRRVTARCLSRRSIRELRQPPLADTAQRLRWVDGEALCVVRSFWQRCRGQLPEWLANAARESVTDTCQKEFAADGQRRILRCGPAASMWRRLLARLRGRRVTSLGLRQAGRVFRLERFGVPGPRLLAFGQRANGGGFVLLQPPANTVPLMDWLATDQPQRLALLRSAGALLRRVHEAGYRITDASVLHVRPANLSPVLSDVQLLRECRSRSRINQRKLTIVTTQLRLNADEAAAFAAGYRDSNVPAMTPLAAQMPAVLPTGPGVPAHHV